MRWRRVILTCAVTLAVTGCSTEVRFKHRGDRCIEHDTDRFLGVPILQDEYPCADWDED